MPSTEIQATTSVTFRVSGTKPSPVHVCAKGGRKWIVASEVCRILGLRTDTVPKLLPEQDRGHATVLTKGSVLYLGLFMWGGLWLRDSALRRTIPSLRT